MRYLPHTPQEIAAVVRQGAAMGITKVRLTGGEPLVRKGIVKPDDVIVVNCSGHTFPVEKHLLDEGWARSVDLESDRLIDKEKDTMPIPQEERSS